MSRASIADVSVEAVAREAGVARATVYRVFPGGRDELIGAVVGWAVSAFFAGLAEDVGDVPDVATLLERGLVAGRRRLDEHAVLQHILRAEADQIVPPLYSVMPVVLAALRDVLAGRLAGEPLRPGVDAGEAADLLARMALSFIGTPGSWDMDDPAAVRRLVRGQLLAGIVEAPGEGSTSPRQA